MRWLRFKLRTLFVLIAIICLPLGWAAYQLQWIRERHAILSRQDVRFMIGNFADGGPPPYAPWSLRLFGERGATYVDLSIVDDERAVAHEMNVDASDGRLTAEERSEIARIATLFPEAFVGAWFRKSR